MSLEFVKQALLVINGKLQEAGEDNQESLLGLVRPTLATYLFSLFILLGLKFLDIAKRYLSRTAGSRPRFHTQWI